MKARYIRKTSIFPGYSSKVELSHRCLLTHAFSCEGLLQHPLHVGASQSRWHKCISAPLQRRATVEEWYPKPG